MAHSWGGGVGEGDGVDASPQMPPPPQNKKKINKK